MRNQYTNQSRFTSQSVNQSGMRSHQGDFESQAIQESLLKWSTMGESGDVVITGESDAHVLKNLQGVLLSLQSEFGQSGNRIVIEGDKKDEYNKRLILLENEIEGLMKRKINFSARDERGGTRTMDYTGILNEKETQVVELEKKINNLEERLRRASARELELENHITHLFSELKRKEEIILAKNEVIMAEVAASNAFRESLNKVKRNIDSNKSRLGADVERLVLEAVNLPDFGSFDIKSDLLTRDGAQSRSKSFQGQNEGQRNKTKLIQLFR